MTPAGTLQLESTSFVTVPKMCSGCRQCRIGTIHVPANNGFSSFLITSILIVENAARLNTDLTDLTVR